MKTKRIFIVILLAAFCILLSSCPGVVPTVVLGNLLSVDGSGHFTQDITYSGGSTTYELNADGTFTITQKDYAGNISNGYKGTYSWAQDTMLLTYNYSQYYDSGSNQWEDYLDAKTETLHYYFSDQHLGYAYAKVANTENTFTNEDKTVIANGNTTTETTTVTITATSFTYNYTYTVDNSAGERTYGERITVNGTIDALYPAGVTWAAGNTVTVSITQTSGQQSYYDDVAEAWSDWSDITSFSKEVRTYAHGGSWVVELSGTGWIPMR